MLHRKTKYEGPCQRGAPLAKGDGMRLRKKQVLVVGVCGAALFAGDGVLAQTGSSPVLATPEKASATPIGESGSETQAKPTDNGQVVDIVVTAERRSESANRTALAITAVQGGELARLNVARTEDLVKVVPALTVAKSQGNTPIYTLRGVGFQTINLTSSSPVGIYVDEVSYTYPYLTNNVVFDLERVEVLKGPQGLLYGRSTTGGLVSYITAKPEFTPSGEFTLSAGNYGSYGVNAHFTGPITSTLAFRIAANVDLATKGWQRSVTRPGDRLGERNRKALRGELLWKPDHSFEALLTLSTWKDDSDTQAPQAIAYAPLNAPFSQAARAAPSVIPNVDNARDADWTPAGYQPAPGVTRPAYKADGRFYGAALRLTYKPADNITITSLTGYNDAKRNDVVNGDGLAIEAVTAQKLGRIKSFSQELRVSGDSDRVNWMVGGYYGNDKLSETSVNYLSDFSTGFQLKALALGLKLNPAAVAASLGVPPPAIPGFVQLAAFNTAPYSVDRLASVGLVSQFPLAGRAKTYAGFVNAGYQITDSLKLTGGVRYTRDSLTNASCAANYRDNSSTLAIFLGTLLVQQPTRIGPDDCLTIRADQSGFSGLVRDKLVEDNLSYRGTLQWTPQTNLLIYGSVAQGYKAGTFPSLAANNASQLEPAKQERLIAFEGGLKAGLFDRRVQLNLAGYYYNYSDKQLYGQVPDVIFGTLARLVNVPKSRSYGGEADVTWRMTSDLTAKVSGSYLNAVATDYVGYDDTATFRDFKGSTLPFSPKWSGSASLSYARAVSEELKLDATILANYQSRSNSRFSDADSITASQRAADAFYNIKARTVVDASVGLGDGIWRLQLAVQNLFNVYYWNSTDKQTDTIFRFAGMPRTYGGSLSFRF